MFTDKIFENSIDCSKFTTFFFFVADEDQNSQSKQSCGLQWCPLLKMQEFQLLEVNMPQSYMVSIYTSLEVGMEMYLSKTFGGIMQVKMKNYLHIISLVFFSELELFQGDL